MVTLTSHTQSVEEMTAAIEAHGERAVAATDPAVVDAAAPSEQPGTPGDSPAATGGESAPASEAGTPSTQDTKPGEPHMSRGNFKSKLTKLEERVSRLSDDLETERGDKSALRQKLADAEAELARLRAPVAVDAKPAEPIKPKRPTLADCDFDQDKYDAALDRYDEEKGAYDRAVVRKEFDDRAAQEETKRQEQERQVAAQKQQKEFSDRMSAGREALPELDENLDQLEGDINLPPVVTDYIFSADSPADLMNFFAKDALEAESAELKRISALSPILQVRTLTRLEERLVKEREEGKGKAAPVAAAPPQAAPAAAPPVPARPKPPKPQVDPIEPVGSRATATTASLGTAGNAKDYFRMRNSGANR